MDAEEQNRRILDQFTRQAAPFAEFPAHSAEDANRLVIDAVGIGPEDTILDLACGPGLVACTFAPLAKHVTGIDLTPAMIDQAKSLQESKGLENLSWHVGDVASLPFFDGAFSVSFTRYSFHHLLDPKRVLAEMVRVCKPGGRVAVVDVYTTSPEQAEAYDGVERLRDPSHVRALDLEELQGLFHDAGLQGVATQFYRLDVGLEDLLGTSFPDPGRADEIRRIFAADLGVDRLGVKAYAKDGAIRFGFPIAVVVGKKPAGD